MATVRIDTQTLELPEPEARIVFEHATASAKRGAFLPITRDTAVWVSTATHISLTIAGGFTDAYEQMIASGPSPRRLREAVTR